MKLFLDSAEIKEIKSIAETGLIDGVTTNPSLIAKSGVSFAAAIKEICEIVSGPVSAEVAATDYEGMMAEGRALGNIEQRFQIRCGPWSIAAAKAAPRRQAGFHHRHNNRGINP